MHAKCSKTIAISFMYLNLLWLQVLCCWCHYVGILEITRITHQYTNRCIIQALVRQSSNYNYCAIVSMFRAISSMTIYTIFFEYKLHVLMCIWSEVYRRTFRYFACGKGWFICKQQQLYLNIFMLLCFFFVIKNMLISYKIKIKNSEPMMVESLLNFFIKLWKQLPLPPHSQNHNHHLWPVAIALPSNFLNNKNLCSYQDFNG